MVAAGIFRQYDIRGIVGKDLTLEAATAIGRAYAVLLASAGAAAPWPSAATIARAAPRSAMPWSGLTESGLDVIDIGVVPTPLLYWSLHHVPWWRHPDHRLAQSAGVQRLQVLVGHGLAARRGHPAPATRTSRPASSARERGRCARGDHRPLRRRHRRPQIGPLART
jgi:hypothetical protein